MINVVKIGRSLLHCLYYIFCVSKEIKTTSTLTEIIELGSQR